VSRPTGFADLAGRRVGVFGYGVEGRAAMARLRAMGVDPVVVDDAEGLGEGVIASAAGGLEALARCEVVLKSPGVPRRRADVLALEAAGVVVTSALNLWLADADASRVVMVTGTKGKSTTTSLIAFLLRANGKLADALGNLGRPPYDPQVTTPAGAWSIVEVSSFQAVDLEQAPARVVVTSLGSDHLDWHGSLEQYRADKLSLTRAPGAPRTFVPATSDLEGLGDLLGGEVVRVGADDLGLAGTLGLVGAHNVRNAALALAVAADALERSPEAVAESARASARDFHPLAGRLTLVATEETPRGVVRYLDDGLATSVTPTLAALEVVGDEPLAILAGGYDRGVDYGPLADALAARLALTAVVVMGPAGERLYDALEGSGLTARRAATMEEAVRVARDALGGAGVVLLSPAAPSFDRYRNWEERSADFSACVREALA
jgi:UDP-N-acetylmuramoylalanine-D-glutamate ligase